MLIENSKQNIATIRNGKYQAKSVREITGNKTNIALQPESLVLISGYKLAMGDKGITLD